MFVHREYPKVLHKSGGLVSPEVNSDEERDAKIAEGWSLRPVPDEPVADPVAAAPDMGAERAALVTHGKRKATVN